MKSLLSEVFEAESTEDLGYSLGKTTHSVKADRAHFDWVRLKRKKKPVTKSQLVEVLNLIS